MSYIKVAKELQAHANKEKALSCARYFKTGVGQYGYGDVFIGISVPTQRLVAKKYYNSISLSDIARLLQNKVHEYRCTALEMLVMKYEKSITEKDRKEIVDVYLHNLPRINNWDLVDTSAPYILGDWLFDKDRKVLYKLANSPILWERRVAIITTLGFIMKGDASTTLDLSVLLMHDREDLLHKAVGWMLREVGKRISRKVLSDFLDQYAKEMPRTMLRYALEHFEPASRKKYMAK